jgi:putative addiction module killer protein
MEIRQTEVFNKWLTRLRDRQARARILLRIRRMEDGNPGDTKSVGEGIRELRIPYGPGYRVYYTETLGEIVLLLCGGDKSSQDRDIRKAKELASEL